MNNARCRRALQLRDEIAKCCGWPLPDTDPCWSCLSRFSRLAQWAVEEGGTPKPIPDHLTTCPKCGRVGLEHNSATGAQRCLYAIDCGYSWCPEKD